MLDGAQEGSSSTTEGATIVLLVDKGVQFAATAPPVLLVSKGSIWTQEPARLG